jgi:hypothetical protein
VSSDNRLYCWGFLVQGTWRPSVPTVVATPPSTRIASVAVTFESVCISVDKATVLGIARSALMCRGINFGGSWGGGPARQDASFTTVETFLGSAREIDARGSAMCRLWSAPGELTCAGRNEYGMLGIGAQPGSTSARGTVTGTFTTFSVGDWHACAFATPANEYRCWGRDEQGQLGLGAGSTGQSRTTPRAVVGIRPPATPAEASVAAGAYHSCAIGRDAAGVKQVYCWGLDHEGQLGNGIYQASSTPQLVGSGVLRFDGPTVGGTIPKL